MKIKFAELSMNDEDTLKKILSLQTASYSIEAKIINDSKIPPLFDTLETLKKCNENFIGIISKDNKLNAMVSYLIENKTMTICRLIVDPNSFKKGYASELLKKLFSLKYDLIKINVSTASKNYPACNLYKKFGFKLHSIHQTVGGIEISNYRIYT